MLNVLDYFKIIQKSKTNLSLFFLFGFSLGLMTLANFNIAHGSHLEVNTTKISENIYLIHGAGADVILFDGTDGVILVDDQYAPVTDKMKLLISNITTNPIKFVINTHLHPDHTGGNKKLGEAGTMIISHDNVRKRLSEDQFYVFINQTVSSLSEKGLPILTFSENMTIYQNNEKIVLIHLDNGHTDGDSIVFFTNNNVVHTGDVFSDRTYPFIDIPHGGSVKGFISSLEKILLTINNETKVVGGHSGISNQTEVKNYLDMFLDVSNKINNMILEGKSLDEIIISKPTSKYDAIYNDHSFVKPNDFIENIYAGLIKR